MYLDEDRILGSFIVSKLHRHVDRPSLSIIRLSSKYRKIHGPTEFNRISFAQSIAIDKIGYQ
jgi:hypothetical protein